MHDRRLREKTGTRGESNTVKETERRAGRKDNRASTQEGAFVLADAD